MSTSIALVTCAEVSSERRMCSAMPLRMAVIGSTVSPGDGCACGVARAAGGCGGGAAGRRAGGAWSRWPGQALGWAPAAGAAARRPPDSMNARMSFFVTRPPAPVPGTRPGSTPCSDAMRATTGDTNLPLPDGCACGGAGAGAGAGAAATGLGLGSGGA